MKIKTLKSIYSLIRDRRSSMPILDDFYIDKDYLYFSNLEIFIRVRHKFPVMPNSKPMVVRADHFLRRMENIKAPYSISCDDHKKVTFTMPETITTFLSDDPIDYPLNMLFLDPLKNTKKTEKPKFLFELPAAVINIMNIASNFVANDEMRPVMSVVVISKDFIASSDAHMLYSKKITELYKDDVMFSTKVIKLILLFPGLSYNISEYKNNLIAESDDVTIWWRKIDGNYPNWRSVVILHPNKFILPVKETIKALDAVEFAVPGASHMVRCKITGNKLEFSGKDLDFSMSSSEVVNILNTDGKNIEWGMKLDFLKKELKTLLDEGYAQVEVRYEDNTKSFLIADRLLLMPMMISE